MKSSDNQKELRVPFSPPDVGEEEIQEVVAALRSGWITTGPRTKELETRVAEYVGASRAVCLNSQTACAETALRVLGVGPGDEVVVPAYTYTATASVVVHLGATLVVIDSQKDCVEMDYDAVEAAITEKTKAIIPVDVGGVPCDYERLFQIVENKKGMFRPANEIQEALGRVAIAADAAHSFGAVWRGRPIGSVADFSSFSFHAVKNFTTAEGGAVSWREIPGIDSEEIYRKFQLLSLHGQSKSALEKSKIGAWEYDVVGPWYKCNMTDVAAAMGLAQMRRYPEMLARRKSVVAEYDAALRPLGVKTLEHYVEGRESSGHLYLTRLPGVERERRDDIIVKMAERGVVCNVHYKPLPMLTAYKNLGFDVENYPNARALFANEITLPLYSRLTDEQVAYVIDSYRTILEERR